MGWTLIPTSKEDLATQLSTIKLTKTQETLLRSSRSLTNNFEVALEGLKALRLRKDRLEQEKQREHEEWLKEYRVRQKSALTRVKTGNRRMGSVKRTRSIRISASIPSSASGHSNAAPNFSRKPELRGLNGGGGTVGGQTGMGQKKIHWGGIVRTDSFKHAKPRMLATR